MKLTRNIILSLVIIPLLIMLPSLSHCSEIVPNDLAHALVEDHASSLELPKRFRTTSFFPDKKVDVANPNLEGLPELHAAASGQFSELQLQSAMQYMPKDNVILVDLRKESHGFVNGVPVSWYINQGQIKNALNINRTPEQVIRLEKELLNDFKKRSNILIYKLEKVDNLPNPPKLHYINPSSVAINLVETEQELVKRHGLKYVRFFVKDGRSPDPGQVDAFISLVNNTSEESWLYFHCRGGVDRSTTFMSMYDILKNSSKVSFVDIIHRQTYIGGRAIDQLPIDTRDWRYELAKDRLNFLQGFYEFVVATKGVQGERWSDWLLKNQGKVNINKAQDSRDKI